MLTLIAALYVILPALLALACVAYAYACPVVLVEEQTTEQVEAEWLERAKNARDQAAAAAINMLRMWRETGVESWRQAALDCYHEALRWHNMILDIPFHTRC